MKYTLETNSYNERRYGKPWIAEVRGKEFLWGSWDGRPGEPGELSIEAEPGALIAYGQKDLRKGRGGVNTWYMAMPNGALWSIGLDTDHEAKAWAKKGWRSYATWRMNYHVSDPALEAKQNEYRSEAARMLGVQSPVDRAAAEHFGLIAKEPDKEAQEPIISLDAFGL